MATTPPTSISSSYQRIGGSTPVITQTAPGPQLSAATQARLKLADQRKLDEEKILAEQRRITNLLRNNPMQYAAEQQAGIVRRAGGSEAYTKFMTEGGGDPNKPYTPTQFRK